MAKKRSEVKTKNRKKTACRKSSDGAELIEQVANPHAAGIDLGAREIYVAAPTKPGAVCEVRKFGTFTADLHALADWLKLAKVKTVAMEATGVYWVPLFQILEQRHFEVYLVNARHVKNVRGRKSDVCDCQWLQQLHRAGLLMASFRPDDTTVRVRALLRHRESLVRQAAECVQRMQKAFNQMNVQLHHVLSNIVGVSGQAIIEAILDGERDPKNLVKLRDPRVKTSLATMVKALEGDWRSEQLFALKQNYQTWQLHQEQLAQTDLEVESLYRQHELTEEPLSPESKPMSPEPSPAPSTPPAVNPTLSTEHYLQRICGVDLTAIPGINVLSAQALLSEVGHDMSRWPTSGHFSAWLGLSPERKITGGKLLSSSTKKVKNRAARLLKICAWTLHKSTSALGDFYRRKRAQLGAPQAITATAHKLARIIYRLLLTREAYDESRFQIPEKQARERSEAHLRKLAQKHGFQLVPTPT